MAESKVVFERLNSFNWSSWKFRMELLLIKEQLYDVVCNTKPETPPADWDKKDGAARATIGLALDNDQLCHVMAARTAKDMWDALRSYHERDSLTNKIHVMRKLFTMQLAENGNMADHLVKVSELVQRLVAMGEDIKEHWIIAILLSSLPRSYDGLITALETRSEEQLKQEYVKGRLLDEWKRRCDFADSDTEKALAASARGGVRRKKICYCCKNEGHFWRDCPKLEVKDQLDECEAQPGHSARVSKAQATNYEGGAVCFLVSGGECDSVSARKMRKNMWCLDSGCVSHLTGDANLLEDLVVCNEAVYLADGRKVFARGRGTGKIEADGMTIAVKNVLFVPGIAGNFLSVPKIVGLGYNVQFNSAGGGILKHNKLIKNFSKKDGLYFA